PLRRAPHGGPSRRDAPLRRSHRGARRRARRRRLDRPRARSDHRAQRSLPSLTEAMDAPPAVAKAIEVEAQGLRYARSGRAILEDFSASFPRGRISVIAGASGAGKTTILRMIACLIRPDRGAVRIDGGADLVQMPVAEIAAFRRRVGMLFQG